MDQEPHKGTESCCPQAPEATTEDIATGAFSRAIFKEFMTDSVRKQMMFVSGETIEPSPETTTLVEQIVQDQVQSMVGRA